MTSVPRPETKPEKLWTESEFLGLPESNLHVELIDGEVVRESPTLLHQERLAAVFERLRAWSRTQVPVPTVAVSPLDIRFAEGRILQPDVSVFLKPLPPDVRMPIGRIPDLCVEIVSLDRVYDRVTKRQVYAAAGVREYWTVVPSLRMVERWTGPGLATRVASGERLVSETLAGFEMDVRALLAE